MRWFVRIGLGSAILPVILICILAVANPPVTTLMLIRGAEGYALHRQWRQFDHIAPAMREAAIASEDLNFCAERWGFDWSAISHQIDIWRAGGRPTGASTITMQLARNLFLWPARSWVRKLAEAWLTPPIALIWSKQRQLEVYLNVVEFGPGVFGAEAAARRWYGISAARLSPAEAASLIALLPAPLRRSTVNPTALTAQKVATTLALIVGHDQRLRCAD